MDPQAVLILVSVILQMVERGATTTARIREILRTEGASDDELEKLDKALSDALARREAELKRLES